MPDRENSNLVMINLSEVVMKLWMGKWIVASVTVVFALGSIIFALSLPNVYTSTVRLSEAESANAGLGSLINQYSGIAGLAGLSLGGNDSKLGYALEVLQSRQFLQLLIEKHDILVSLMAAEDWDEASNELIIDTSHYNVDDELWVRPERPPYGAKPSLEEAYEEWEDTLVVNTNGAFVSLSVTHVSPSIAKDWLEVIVEEINAAIKTQDVSEARRSIEYLTQELERTSVRESRTLLFDLIQTQTETVMLANVRDEYVFKVIDPPLAPLKKSGPSRATLCIVITFLGFILGCLAVLSRDFFLAVGSKGNSPHED